MKYNLIIFTILLSGCSSTGVVPAGDGTLMIAKTDGAPATSGAEVTADLYREAHDYCEKRQMDFKTISVDEKDWKAFVRLASSKVEFRCINKTISK